MQIKWRYASKKMNYYHHYQLDLTSHPDLIYTDSSLAVTKTEVTPLRFIL